MTLSDHPTAAQLDAHRRGDGADRDPGASDQRLEQHVR